MVENETLRTVISGTAGGIASILAVHPLDTVRTRLQAAHASACARLQAELREVEQEAECWEVCRQWERILVVCRHANTSTNLPTTLASVEGR